MTNFKMTNLMKTATVATLLSAASAPAFADAHLDMGTMTCAQFKELGSEDQMEVASMAIAEVDSGADGMPTDGEPKATDDSVGTTTAAEATEGDTTAGAKSDGDEDVTTEVPMDQAAMDAFILVCDRNLDALVSEAAAGLDGTK